MKRKIVIIGAGAAGLMAACAALEAGADVTVLEKNEKAGKKIYITGKGRCNFTNACEPEEFFPNVRRNPKFLYHALYAFPPSAMIDFLEKNGCPTKVERGRRAFPESDHASDVTKALTEYIKKHGGKIRYHETVRDLLLEADPENPEEKRVRGVVLENGTKYAADAVILAAGGLSYPSTGSTGDGYRLAQRAGLAVTPTSPSLVPLVTKEAWPLTLQGLSLKNVSVSLWERDPDINIVETQENSPQKPAKKKRKKPIWEGFGEMMFTHFGLTGPLILTASTYCDFAKVPQGYRLELDCKPALTQEQLRERIDREFALSRDKALVNALRPLFPERLAREMALLFVESVRPGRNPEEEIQCRAVTFNEKERDALAALTKCVPMTITGTRGFPEAIITKGGISIKEWNPATMEAKKVHGLYGAGEVLDLDAVTGGYNLQIAWSTGHLAGASAAGSDEKE
ncbi:MAG: NAD(P)/FAD-dependent oxidoreductase [Lachnospiraceae bacterium]